MVGGRGPGIRPKGAGAVMATRVHGAVEEDDPQTALYRALEFFPLAPWAARFGGELVQRFDPGKWWAWEPTCGQGHMAHGLGDYFEHLHATDIHAYGDFQHGPPLDFLSSDADAVTEADYVCMNPPFKHAEAFLELALRRARRGVLVFNRATWFETIGRYRMFFGERVALTVYAPFFERVPLHLGRWEPDGDTATAYAWFLFIKPRFVPPAIRELRRTFPDAALTVGIPPGQCARLTRPSDLRLFGPEALRPRLEIFPCP